MKEIEKILGSEKLYKTLCENSSDPIVILDNKGRFIKINKKVEKILGYKRKKLIGKKFTEAGILTKKSSAVAFKNFIKRMAGFKIKPYEVEIIKKNGEMIIGEINAAPIKKDGEIIGDMVIIRDITGREKIKEKIKNSEERLKILFEYAPDAIYLNDLKGNFIDVNKSAEELIGYKREELIGKSFLKLKILSPDQIPNAAEGLAKNALGQPTGPDEFTLIRKNGTRVKIETRSFPVKIKGKTVVLGIARDISQRGKSEEELKKLNLELQSKVEELERFTRLAVGRELRMIELKKKIKELETKLKKNK